jgi:ligand-binding sensor domain-containing protein
LQKNWFNLIIIVSVLVLTIFCGCKKKNPTQSNPSQSNWTTYNTSNSGLASNEVFAVAIDSSGNKWFGTGGGVSRFDGVNWTTYN